MRRKVIPFTWRPGDPPPTLEEHSRAKLDVLRRYLQAYFDRLGILPTMDVLRLDLIDGFSGGGTFLWRKEVVAGTPLVMLEEAAAAERRLNENRAKPLRFDVAFHFVDVCRSHVDALKMALKERDDLTVGREISFHVSAFGDILGRLISTVRSRQPRAGRSIFLLDQCGYTDATVADVAKILAALPSAEVILTFAAEALTNLISTNDAFIRDLPEMGLTKDQLQEIAALRDGAGGRAIVQRRLRAAIRASTNAHYDTPFFIRPASSRRALWFVHLSRHPTARDVMVRCHWSESNIFEHYGPGDFGILGWDALKDGSIPLFGFNVSGIPDLREHLLESLPREIHQAAASAPVAVNDARRLLANDTAARFEDLDETLLRLHREREIEILNPEGRLRSRGLRHVHPHDRISIPRTLLLPGIARRR